MHLYQKKMDQYYIPPPRKGLINPTVVDELEMWSWEDLRDTVYACLGWKKTKGKLNVNLLRQSDTYRHQ